MIEVERLQPRWVTIEGAARYCGLSKPLLEVYCAKKLVRSSNMKQPGMSRGRRLIDLRSLDELIERNVDE